MIGVQIHLCVHVCVVYFHETIKGAFILAVQITFKQKMERY